LKTAAVRYFDLRRHWTRRIEPHLADPELNRILVRDFNRFTHGRWGKRFTAGMYPEEFESCDWRIDKRPPYPRFWRYVKHGACHWLANFALRLAMLAEPERPWRILTSDAHSTVRERLRCRGRVQRDEASESGPRITHVVNGFAPS
jgi:hypothetical protein